MAPLVVISGGTKGIGRALVFRFAEAGFDVATCSRSGENLVALRKEFSLKFKENVLYTQPADLADKLDCDKWVESLINLNRSVDVLINNTGLYLPGQVHNEPEGQLEMMIETNLYSAYHLTRGLIPIMIAAKKGHIFTICSTASVTPYVNGGSYCISKYALHGFTQVLREEMKPHNIRVTAILPGATRTSSWDGVDIPEERFMPSEDVAEMIYTTYELSKRSVVESILMRPQLGDL